MSEPHEGLKKIYLQQQTAASLIDPIRIRRHNIDFGILLNVNELNVIQDSRVPRVRVLPISSSAGNCHIAIRRNTFCGAVGSECDIGDDGLPID